jgi:hypothetical protein
MDAIAWPFTSGSLDIVPQFFMKYKRRTIQAPTVPEKSLPAREVYRTPIGGGCKSLQCLDRQDRRVEATTNDSFRPHRPQDIAAI